MEPGFSLRAMTPADGPAIAALSDQSSDTGAIGFHNVYHYDAYATNMALHENACGVVAEASDHDGIVGMGMMSLGECQYEGAVRPFAYLFSLSVHPDYRRRGIASQLAGWRVQTARKRFGPEGVIYAGVQQGNTGSLRTASHWSNQVVMGRTLVTAVKMRQGGASPINRTELEIQPAEANDYEEIARQQNAFYADYNLYPRRSAEAIATWHAQTPFGEPIRDYYVVRDRQSNLLAGLSVTEEGKLNVIEIKRLSRAFKIANYFAKFFPADGVMRRLHVKDLWFRPGMADIGKYLWETMRWQLRNRGTVMMMFIDRQSPLAKIIQPPWYLPQSSGSLVLSVPIPMREERPLYLLI